MTKIRGRLAEPWLKRQWWLLRSEFMMLRWLIVVRSESFFGTARSRSAAAGVTDAGADTAAAGRRLNSLPVLGGIATWASSKGGPGDDQRRSPGPVLNWLRPALAVAGAVVLVVAGVFALGQIREGIVSLSSGSGVFSPSSSSQAGPSGGTNGSGSRSSAGSQGPSHRGSAGPKPAVSNHVGASTSPSPCVTSSSSSPAPSPSPSSSPPPPSPTASPTTSPTTTPTPTTSPTPTISNGPASGFQSPPPVGGYPAGGSGASTTALVCVQGPGPSPTSVASPA